ncbi:hypothetical protein QQ045_030518 [Rhodiola kirilowii]
MLPSSITNPAFTVKLTDHLKVEAAFARPVITRSEGWCENEIGQPRACSEVMPPKKDIHESAEIVLVATAGGM